MKRYLYCIFFLSLMVVPLMGIPYEQTEEYTQKQAILNERAARFKAETGFAGDISYNLQSMQFSTISGSFKEIEVAAPQDTVFMRSVFDQIVSKVMPYISAREEQLKSGKVRSNMNGSGVIYWQKVNGFSIEGGGGSLRIHYNLATHQLNINNGTADISSDPISINLSLEQALQIAQDEVFNGADAKPYNPRIAYTLGESNGGNEFYLCYILNFWDYTVCVDVSEPIIRKVAPNRVSRSFSVNVLGNVYNEAYTDTINIPPSQQSMGSVLVQTPIDSLYADSFGQQTVSDSIYTWLKTELRNHEIFYVVEHPDTTRVVQCDSVDVSGNQLSPLFYDNIARTANAYYHAHHQQQFLNELVADDMLQPWMLKIVTKYPDASGGALFHNFNTIRISTNSGKLSHVVRHELSHANMYSVLLTLFNNTDDDTKDAMDEAFAVYLPCAAIESPYCIYGNPQDPQRIDTLNHISTVTPLYLNERAYEDYDVRHTIASAWWEIRDKIGNNQFDQFLIDRVKFDVDGTNALRYKPRYFYNILMRNSTPSNQLVIDKAYSGRGLHFTPQVESYSEVNRYRNVFSPGDQVHAKITKAPQNTPFDVYVIRHDDYIYVEGANVSTLTPHVASGFSNPITGNRTDNEGKWSGLIWTIPTELENVDGGYDIIVNFGSPEAPDNRIHFTYTAANVMDGFDGLHVPGFTVTTPTTIDIVLALDCSPSMSDRSQLARTARQFVGQLEDGDRVGVFGFAAEIGGNQYIQDVVINRIPSGSLGLTPILNNKDYLSGQGVITFPSNYPYLTYSTDMRTPFVNGYLS